MALDTGEAAGKGSTYSLLLGSADWCSHSRSQYGDPHKAEIDLLLDPAVLKGLYIVLYKYCLYVHCCFLHSNQSMETA